MCRISQSQKVPKVYGDFRVGLREEGFGHRLTQWLLRRAVHKELARRELGPVLKAVLISTDNASFARNRKFQRLVSRQLLSEQVAWTMFGQTQLDKTMAEAGLDGTTAFSDLPPSWVAADATKAGFYYKAAVADAERRPGGVCSHPLGLHLPESQAEVDALGLVAYDGTTHGIAEVCPAAIDLSPKALTEIFLVPETVELEFLITDFLYQLALRSVFRDGSINDIPGPTPEPQPKQWLEGVPGQPGQWRISETIKGWRGMAAHLGHKGHAVHVMPDAPAKVEETAAVGLLQAKLLTGQKTGYRHPGLMAGFARQADGAYVPTGNVVGDSSRPFSASDNATVTQHSSNLDRLYKMIFEGFHTPEEARATLELLSIVSGEDELGAQDHNRMINLANALGVSWGPAGLEDLKDLLGRTNVDPTKVQTEVRRKVEMGTKFLDTWVATIVRRLHLSGKLALVARVASDSARPSMLYEAAGYKRALIETVRETGTVDGQWEIWNIFALDLMLPIVLDKMLSRYGAGVHQRLLRLNNLPSQQLFGNTNAMPNAVARAFDLWTRSAWRNAVVISNSSVAMAEGTVDDLADLDDIQEDIVRLGKDMVPVETTARDLESVITAAGSNLDLVLHLKPYLKTYWANIRARRIHRTGASAAGDELERSWLRRIVGRTLDFVDPGRTFDPAMPSVISNYAHAYVLRMDGRRTDPMLPRTLLQAPVWSYLSEVAGPPQLVLPGLWAERQPSGRGGHSLRFGDHLLAVTLYPTGFDGGTYRIGEAPQRSGGTDGDADASTAPTAPTAAPLVLKGHVPAPYGRRHEMQSSAALNALLNPLYFADPQQRIERPAAALHTALDALPIALELAVLQNDAMTVRWEERAASASDAPMAADGVAALYEALPDGCILVSIGTTPAARAFGGTPTSTAALATLTRALLCKTPVAVGPPPRSAEALLTDLLDFNGGEWGSTPPVLASGVPAPPLQSGRRQQTAARAKVPAASRRLRLRTPPWPIDWTATGDAMPVWLWTRTNAQRSREAAHGLPRLGNEELGLVAYHQRQASTAERRDREVEASARKEGEREAKAAGSDAAQVRAAGKEAAIAALESQGSWASVPAARLEETLRLTKHVLPRFSLGLKEQTAVRAVGGAPSKPKPLKEGAADVWRGALAFFRLSTADASRLCAANSNLPGVRARLSRWNETRAARAKANGLLLELHLQGSAAFDFGRAELQRRAGSSGAAAAAAAAALAPQARAAALAALQMQYSGMGAQRLGLLETMERTRKAIIARRKVLPGSSEANLEQVQALQAELVRAAAALGVLRSQQADLEKQMDALTIRSRGSGTRGAGTIATADPGSSGSEGEGEGAADADDNEDGEEDWS